MTADGQIAQPLSRRRILLLTSTAMMAALLIIFGAVLPAEYNRDPLGLGKLTGIDALWAPPERKIVSTSLGQRSPAQSQETPFRSDVIEIPLMAGADPDRGDEVEYKVHLKKGATFIYSWEVPGISNAEEFYTEFHGHTLGGATMVVADYRKAVGAKDNGVLTASFDGIHGWYFQNQSIEPVTVRLRLSGFYELIPPGQPGNEAGLQAK